MARSIKTGDSVRSGPIKNDFRSGKKGQTPFFCHCSLVPRLLPGNELLPRLCRLCLLYRLAQRSTSSRREPAVQCVPTGAWERGKEPGNEVIICSYLSNSAIMLSRFSKLDARSARCLADPLRVQSASRRFTPRALATLDSSPTDCGLLLRTLRHGIAAD